MLKNDTLDRWDRDHFFHLSTHLAQHARGESPSRIISGGSGIWIEDRTGNRLLDAFAGLYCPAVLSEVFGRAAPARRAAPDAGGQRSRAVSSASHDRNASIGG